MYKEDNVVDIHVSTVAIDDIIRLRPPNPNLVTTNDVHPDLRRTALLDGEGFGYR